MKDIIPLLTYTLKKKHLVKLDPERVHWGQTSLQVNDNPKISQLA